MLRHFTALPFCWRLKWHSMAVMWRHKCFSLLILITCPNKNKVLLDPALRNA
jgi:hypothetical protein